MACDARDFVTLNSVDTVLCEKALARFDKQFTGLSRALRVLAAICVIDVVFIYGRGSKPSAERANANAAVESTRELNASRNSFPTTVPWGSTTIMPGCGMPY